jgi:hypothetical protein
MVIKNSGLDNEQWKLVDLLSDTQKYNKSVSYLKFDSHQI